MENFSDISLFVLNDSQHLNGADCLFQQSRDNASSQWESGGGCNVTDVDEVLLLNGLGVHNQTLKTWDSLDSPVWLGVVIALYSVVIILGALLNALVVATVIKTRQMWNATNIFIANLATADIFVCVFDLPLSLYQTLTGSWIFGRTLCHVIPMTFGVVVYTSTLTLTMIAVDRFMLIVFPLKRRMTVGMALLLVVIIALTAMAVAAPIAVFSSYEVHNFPELRIHRQICRERWPTPRHGQIYTIVTLVAQYFLPLAVILCLYALIFRHLRQRLQKRSSRKTKTTKMLVAVVLVFAVTWTPFHLYAIILDFKHTLVPSAYIRLIDLLLKIFALSSSCINPFLYGWLNDNYRTAFLSIIRRPTATPSGIQREDSDELSRTRGGGATHTISVTPLKQLYQKISPGSGGGGGDKAAKAPPRASPSPSRAHPELLPLTEPPNPSAGTRANGCSSAPPPPEKQVVVTVENGHCTATVQTPLLT